MMKVSVALVLIVTALQQLGVYCNAVDLRHIHLSFDGNIDQRYHKMKSKMDQVIFKNLESVQNLGEGNFRLYITANY